MPAPTALSGEGLTDRQRRILTFIRDWVAEHGYPPSMREVGEAELVVVHGAHIPKRDEATGKVPLESADHLADLWIRRGDHPLPVRPERHPPLYAKYGRRATGVRNSEMAKLGADLGLGFIRADSAGSTGMNRFAEEEGIPTKVLRYEDLPALESSRGR